MTTARSVESGTNAQGPPDGGRPGRRRRPVGSLSRRERSPAVPGRTRPLVWRLVCLAVIVQGVPLVLEGSRLFTLDLALIYAIAALGLSVIFSMGGLLSVAQAAVMAAGGYTLILLFGDALGLVPALAAACVAGAVVSTLTGVVGARVRSHYFVLASLALASALLLVISNARSVTGGADGMALKAIPTAFGMELSAPGQFFRIAVVLLIVVWYLTDALRSSRPGLAMTAMTADEYVARASGISIHRHAIFATAVGGAFGGLAGGLLSIFDGYIGPQNFALSTAVLLLLIVVVAGAGRSASVVVAAIILTFLSEGLLSLAEVGKLVYGLGLIFLILVAPEGLGGLARGGRRLIRMRTPDRLWRRAL